MKNVGDGNVNRLAWERRDVERHFDVLDMVAGCKAGADCEGWGALLRRPSEDRAPMNLWVAGCICS